MAREYLEWAIPVHQNRNNVAALGACFFTLGSLELEQNNFPEAEKLLLRSLDICRKGGNVIFELWVLPMLCELYLKMKEFEKAAGYVDRGFELLKPDQNWYGLPALMHLAKGMLVAEQQNWETAIDCFGQAIHINRQYQLPWDEAKVSYEWGMLYLTRDQAGDRENASEKFERSLEIFQWMGAKKDVEKVLTKKELVVK
jgi:tetratricopeptide (TPR) repeat protein